MQGEDRRPTPRAALRTLLDLRTDRPDLIEQAAALLFDGLRPRTDAWPDLAAARREVLDSLEPHKISRVMLDETGRVIGWIGGQPEYDGNVWELHPLVVARPHQGRGIGRALVRDLETLVARRGAFTLRVGSDDERNETSLGGADLYADFPAAIRDIRNLSRHPYEFYQRVGFTIIGVMPDANGRGRPDIYLAKRIDRISIRRERLDSPVARTLIGRLNAELAAAYPEEGANHFRLDPDEVAPGQGAFFVVYREAEPVGCGAVRRLDGPEAEVKRMFVSESQRGRGLGRALLDTLEEEARALGATRLLLETGTRQREAVALYERAGFREIPLYGEYVNSPLTSLCMAKEL